MKTTIKETTPPTKPVINLTEKHHLKYIILILEAHIASIGDGRPYNVMLQESLKANNIVAVIPNRDSQKIMDIYSNPKQKQNDHVPEEFLCESSSSSDESSDEEELQPPQTEDESKTTKKTGKVRKIPQNQLQPLITNNPDRIVSLYASTTKPKAFNFIWPSEDSPLHIFPRTT